jgi:hypothetical protein
MTKFIQICASRNDLFALDDEGDVYQFHFNVKTWVKLVANRESDKGRGMTPTARAPEEGEEAEHR